MKKVILLVILLVLLNLSTVFAQIPGKYEVLTPYQPPKAHSLDQVIIDEVLAFDCGHCYEFFKMTYPQLKEKFGNKIKFIVRPIGWSGHDPGRLYFIAKKKGKEDKVMAMIFEFIHEKGLGKNMYDRDKLQFVAKLNSLSEEFKVMMDDEEIIRKMNESAQWAKDRNIESTPTLVVANSIKVNRDYSNMVTVINALLKKPVN